MLKLKHKRKKAGQALVEFALTVTVLFFFLSAIIDLGLAFFAHQGLKGAAYEAVSYGALFPIRSDGTINTQEIRDRLRYESGAPSDGTGARFVNLFDLDNNGAADPASVQADRITITFIPSPVPNSVPVDCANPATMMRQFCDIRVSVRYRYKPFFSFASLLGAQWIELTAIQQHTLP
ncbi:MAG: pilus assembly protein [Chloroflexi bacterium]|nr:pilus assembly protein [Chloroflexota bacterium]